ncbi:pheromone-binding protein Gp-9-like [Camponotus floridanus]|uniref:pheromone-binding protein Gp-9-like n=1 Tax=Camponotus floridanus TaxID=104421 RepID=UPI000DC6B426|nr:pheromone-binding protein Gp-9-like [Camponotus floridanus]
MKIIVLCVCVLGFASSNLIEDEIKRQFKSAVSREDNFETCMTENNVTFDDWYREEQIMTDVHKKPENEEKTRNLGCTIACFLKKENLIEDSKIKEGKVHAKINKIYDGSRDEGKAHKIARDCMKEVKNITEECEKCFSLFTCAVRAVHKSQKHEEHEGPEINENEETEQTI